MRPAPRLAWTAFVNIWSDPVRQSRTNRQERQARKGGYTLQTLAKHENLSIGGRRAEAASGETEESKLNVAA